MRLNISRRTLIASLFGLTLCLSSVYSAPAADELSTSHANVRAAITAQNSVTPKLMRTPGILGTAVGLNPGGQISVVIYVDQNGKNAGSLVAALQGQITGIPVHVELTDQFRALGKPGGAPGGPGGVSHTAVQDPPIQLGTSGGWRFDLANGFCCGGTLGSLVQVNGVQYILSNYHVFEADIVTGGNGTVAVTGNPVVQPGLIDINCNQSNGQDVGTLFVTHSLPLNNVDVGLAQVVDGMVRSDGAILEIGKISSQTVLAAVGQPVKKSSRTTGLTRSSVAALNATISVAYDNECAGGAAFTRTYTGQIVINNKGSKFLQGGDSGSLMVEDAASNPHAIGLLYAGSSTTAIANPINDVLTFIGSRLGGAATMVGN